MAWKHDVQVMIEGPGHVPMHKIKENVDKQMEHLPRGAVLHARAARDRHRAGLRPHHVGHRRGDDRLVRHGDALLRDAEGAPRAAERTTSRPASSPTRSRRTRPIWPRGTRARIERDNALSKARFEFRWQDQFNLSLDPTTAKDFHDETLPADAAKHAHFCSMCGPNFCSMRMTEDVRAMAEEGMADKAREFRDKGGEIYQPAAAAAKADAAKPSSARTS